MAYSLTWLSAIEISFRTASSDPVFVRSDLDR
jgi:hypothetical protein